MIWSKVRRILGKVRDPSGRSDPDAPIEKKKAAKFSSPRRHHRRRANRTSLRRALVIGLSEYDHSLHFPSLPGAERDASKIADMLENLYGFSVSRIIGECDGDTLKKKRSDFLAESRDADVVLIFFAGHGVRADVDTFLIPSSGEVGEIARDFLQHCLEANDLIHDVAARSVNARRIFLFDCCRKDIQALFGAELDRTQVRSSKSMRFSGNDFVLYSASIGEAATDDKTFGQALVTSLEDSDQPFVDAVERAIAEFSGSGEARQDQGARVEHRGSEFDGWYLKSEKSDYKATAPGFKPYELSKNITALGVASGGKFFAVASGEISELRVVSASDFRDFKSLKSHSKIYSVDFSPQGDQVVFGCKDGSLGIWEHQSDNEAKFLLNVFAGPVNHIEWARKNDRIVAVSADRTMRVFAAETFEELSCGSAHESDIWSATIHRDGNYVVTASRDRTCRLWHLDRTTLSGDGATFKLRSCDEILNLGSPVRSVRFSSKGLYLAVGTQDGKIAVYEFDTNTESFRVIDRFSHKRSSKFADPRKLLEGLNHYRIHKTKLKKKKPLSIDNLDRNLFVLALDFSPDDHVLAYGTNIDGYHLHANDVQRHIAGMEECVDQKFWRYRVPRLRYCQRKKRLYIAAGSKLHCLYY